MGLGDTEAACEECTVLGNDAPMMVVEFLNGAEMPSKCVEGMKERRQLSFGHA